MLILEGGHVFKDPETKQPLTQRINQADVEPTLKWLENILDIDLVNNTIGTTGKKPTSGDLDIAVDSEEYSKEEVIASLARWVDENIPDANLKDYIAKTGIEVHFKTPINGNAANGYVQTDLMFGDAEYMKWSSQGEASDKFKGQHRMILLASIASFKGYRWSGFNGLTPRSGGETIRNTQKITDILIGSGHSPDDLTSIDKILNIIKDDPNYEKMIADAVVTFPKYGVKFPEMKNSSTPASLQEGNVNEGPRIQHAEDLIFWEGSNGALRALDILASLATKEGQSATTVKWDGSPAVVFGRDESGQFIFTDKSGFTAKGYDGKAKSPEELENIFVDIRRKGKGKEVTPDYQNFVGALKQVFIITEQSLPEDYRGYFFGDLLYTQTPQVVDGSYQFKPNVVTYNIKADSEIGKKIEKSKVGVVVHREIDLEGNKTPVKNYSIFQGTDILVVPPVVVQQPVTVNTKEIASAKSLVKANASKIDDFLNKDKLRSLKISNFADIMYTYLNSKVDTGLEDLGKDFLDWIGKSSSIGDNPKQNINVYVSENMNSFSALWQVVTQIMNVKNNIIQQLESQDAPVKSSIGQMQGGEGYVVANASGDIKLVDRTGFTKANRSMQREGLLREQPEVSAATVALFPGSFKPPHKGHMAIVEYLASKYDEVIVIVSAPLKEARSSINARTAADIFNLYIKDAGLRNAQTIVSNFPSPMGEAYSIVEKTDFNPNTKVVIATSTKDAGRYPQKDLDKAALKNPTNPKASEITIPAIESDSGEPFSARDFRAAIVKVKSGEGSEDMLWEFTPEYISIGTKETILNLLSVGPMQINELYDIIKEMSTMAAGSVEGSSGSVTKNKKEKRKRGVTPMQTMNEEEQELREVVRAAISLFKKNEMLEFKKSKLEEQHLRYIVGKLIQEASDGQPVHDNTGINVLEDLLKKIIPVIQVDYKIMTTSEIQRKSFRAHILNAVQNSLKPDIYKKEDALPSTPALNEKKAKKVKIDLNQEEAEELDRSKFIDVFDTEKKKIEDEEATKTPESRLSTGLEGQKLDSTGRNMALQTFKKIDTSIVDAYVMLDDLQDKDLFYDYLITNLKLYFDKFEEEMADMPDSEPTTPEYAQEKADLAAEDEPITI